MLTTETWLNDHTSKNAIIVPAYKSFRKSRQTQRGGSHLVYVRKFILTTLFQDPRLNPIQDAAWFGTEIGKEVLLIGLVYRPPSSRQNNF